MPGDEDRRAPLVDALLEVREFWRATRSPTAGTTPTNRRGSGCSRLRNGQAIRCAVVITPEGEPLIEPSDAELASRVGRATTPSKDFYELIVIGGGRPGWARPRYGASERLRTVLVERTATGGRPGGARGNREMTLASLTGCPRAADRPGTAPGGEVRGRGADATRDVIGLDIKGSARRVRSRTARRSTTHDHPGHRGVLPAAAGPGLSDLTGRGVYYGRPLTEASACLGQDIYVVGRRRTSAGQAAVYLARHAKSVTILVRGPFTGKFDVVRT